MTGLRTAITLGITLISAVSSADALSEYLSVRKKVGVTTTSSPAALDALVGAKTLEVQGNVKGMIRVENSCSIFLVRTDGQSQYVRCPSVPSWLTGVDLPVRMLVNASRETPNADLKCDLVAVVSESVIAPWEAKSKPAPKSPAPTTGRTASSPSRGGSPLRGTIGGARGGGSYDPGAGTASKSPGDGRSWSVPASDALPVYAQFVKSQNKRLSDAEAYRIAEAVISYSLQAKVDARLIMAMIMAESSFNPYCRSGAGAEGILQLMPGTAAELGVKNSYDSADNIRGAVKLVRGHLEKYTRQTGDELEGLALALAAYNAGPGAVSKHNGVPPYRETQNYVKKVISFYRALCGG